MSEQQIVMCGTWLPCVEVLHWVTDKVPLDDKCIITFQDYMEERMVGSFEAPITAVHADNRYMSAPSKSERTQFSSYSGSSFNTHFDPDNVAIDKSPVYQG